MPTTSQLSVDASTVALYHLDGTAGTAAKVDNAEGTASRDLTEISSPPSTTGVIAPTTDGAYALDGSTDYLTTADDTAFDGLTNFTLEFWIFPNAVTDNIQPITKWDNVTANSSYRTIFISGGLDFEISNGTTSGLIVPTQTLSAAGLWYYIAYTYDGSQASGSRGKVYINGNDVTSSDATPSTMNAGTVAFLLGNRSGLPAGGYFNGNLDEIRISNTTRTATEIYNYYNGTVGANLLLMGVGT